MHKKQQKQIGFSLSYFVVMLVIAWLFQEFFFRPMAVHTSKVPYSEFIMQLNDGKIEELTLNDEQITYPCHKDKEEYICKVVRVKDPDLIKRLTDAGVSFSAEAPQSELLPILLGWIIPLLPFALIWYVLWRRMSQGGPGVMSIGRSKAQEIAGEMSGVKFKDIGGLEEIEVELKEIIEFLKDPAHFTRLGAKLPKGVLLVGPPGTGKTLLAKATAGEADVPFFSISGSNFVEMFVGVGAARVRDLFEQAKSKAPCIVFIDEIDAIGQARATIGTLGTNDEREQTLNQLLAEMDGFEPNQGVVIMAATNRPEVLDQALLRPGRFDRQIQVSLPTEAGRRQIIKIHTQGVKLGPDCDMEQLAQITSGFSGADLANVVNEAALLAVRKDRDAVTMEDFDLAIERVVAGLQRKIALKGEIKRKIAYHEGGHALVAYLQPDTDTVHKVSIIPTSKGALGYTMQMPSEDTYLLTERELQEQLAVMLGGRAAELLIFGEPSTGASNDLERATALARRMVTEFGMTEALGPIRYSADPTLTYLHGTGGVRQDLSPETLTLIDQETRRLVEESQTQALELLRNHRASLDEIALVLVKKEVISGKEIAHIVGEEPGDPVS